jgi:chlorite dismutase
VPKRRICLSKSRGIETRLLPRRQRMVAQVLCVICWYWREARKSRCTGRAISKRLEFPIVFVCGRTREPWPVIATKAVVGDSLPSAACLDVVSGAPPVATQSAAWVLRGVTSNTRYVTEAESAAFVAKQPDLGRSEATRAALIPIRKTTAWCDLPQDERRRILEESSRHITTGLKYLPAIARRLHHCRDFGSEEQFDFLMWFDYAPERAQAFEDLAGELCATEEWRFVDREVDIRLAR